MKDSIRFTHMIKGVLLLTGMLIVTSCGSDLPGEEGQEAGSRSTVSFAKDGSLRSSIQESFGESYYDKDELQRSILEQVADYNNNAGESRISVEKVEMSENSIEVLMTYAGEEDYAAFNRVTFFTGTPAQAEAAGYDLNVVLSGVKDPQDTAGRSDILGMEDAKLLITGTGENVALDGRAVYVSENVSVSNNAKTVRLNRKEEEEYPEEEEVAYIIYK